MTNENMFITASVIFIIWNVVIMGLITAANRARAEEVILGERAFSEPYETESRPAARAKSKSNVPAPKERGDYVDDFGVAPYEDEFDISVGSKGGDKKDEATSLSESDNPEVNLYEFVGGIRA